MPRNREILIACLLPAISLFLAFGAILSCNNKRVLTAPVLPTNSIEEYWRPRDISTVADSAEKRKLYYGKQLIVHSSQYFGPRGIITKTCNGLNCQNCHLQAGTAIFANNYGSVYSLYPKFRARSGQIESVYKRVNDCFERSLNGKPIDTAGREMQAMVSYINFIGSNVPKGKKAAGSGFRDLTFLSRAADSVNGKRIYLTKCQSCHQPNGQGLFSPDNTEYIYPPLWGEHSYNDGAGIYRISALARYVKCNMPLGANFRKPQLSDEEAWDVAAFVCAQSRPHGKHEHDWPDISMKPFDLPYGPYKDHFSEQQHKYGPFAEIVAGSKTK